MAAQNDSSAPVQVGTGLQPDSDRVRQWDEAHPSVDRLYMWEKAVAGWRHFTMASPVPIAFPHIN